MFESFHNLNESLWDFSWLIVQNRLCKRSVLKKYSKQGQNVLKVFVSLVIVALKKSKRKYLLKYSRRKRNEQKQCKNKISLLHSLFSAFHPPKTQVLNIRPDKGLDFFWALTNGANTRKLTTTNISQSHCVINLNALLPLI